MQKWALKELFPIETVKYLFTFSFVLNAHAIDANIQTCETKEEKSHIFTWYILNASM